MNEIDPVEAIIVNAREYFPYGSAQVHWDNSDDRWVLLVGNDGLTKRWTAPTLDALLNKAENLMEYEDEQDEWELKQQVHHEP